MLDRGKLIGHHNLVNGGLRYLFEFAKKGLGLVNKRPRCEGNSRLLLGLNFDRPRT